MMLRCLCIFFPGTVSAKNECNIMVKNAVDVIFGGMGYWICGFGISYGNDSYSNAFMGFGNFFTDSSGEHMGAIYSKYFFQVYAYPLTKSNHF